MAPPSRSDAAERIAPLRVNSWSRSPICGPTHRSDLKNGFCSRLSGAIDPAEAARPSRHLPKALALPLAARAGRSPEARLSRLRAPAGREARDGDDAVHLQMGDRRPGR